MKLSKRMHSTCIALTLALLSGCSTSSIPWATSPGGSASSTRHSASSGDLIYTSGYTDGVGAQVYMLSYPQGQLVGSITQTTQGMCSDTNGNVWLLYRNAAIEYAHGGTTPIKTLHIPGAQTNACAVDPSSGDVAVVFYCPPCGYQNLAIFPNGSAPAVRYSAPYAYTASYDGQGDLFLGGASSSAISELPKGSQTFTTITLSKQIQSPGQLQWDGTYVTLQSLYPPGGIYRISVSGSTGTIVGETKFGRYMKRMGNAWISTKDGSVVLPFSVHGNTTNNLGIWNYPKGGHAISIIKNLGAGYHGFYGVTISVAPTR
jgi:hypothetical protein